MKNLDQCTTFQGLLDCANSLKKLQDLDLQSREGFFVSRHDLLSYSFATTHLSESSVEKLQCLADEQHVIARFEELKNGHPWGKNKPVAVQHHHLRNQSEGCILKDDSVLTFIEQSRASRQYSAVVYVGIGGSYLGPEVLYQALRHVCPSSLDVFFLHSLDLCNLKEVMDRISFEDTLFVFSSKSGGTFETFENLKQIQKEAEKIGFSVEKLAHQSVAITCKGTVLDDAALCQTRFYITPEIVGRFSVTSAIGMLIVGLSFGLNVVQAILDGAFALDESASNKNLFKNPSLAAALVTIWERNVLKYPSKAIIPYSYGLSRFPAFLQQLICESNGKRVSVLGDVLMYPTSPAIFGEPGTEAQHSFFQMLHQGTDVIPVQFISLGKKFSKDLFINMQAQRMALACGNTEENPFEFCPGNSPSTVVEMEGLSAKTLGALIAFYENMVMFEGFLWNINSFDQEGVQLGKKLAEKLYV